MISPLDLHVLSTPPAFVLSQDQTLVFNPSYHQPNLPHQSLAKATCTSVPANYLISESDCFARYPPKDNKLFSISLCIVFKDRVAVLRATSDLYIISPRDPLVNTFLC